MSAPRIHPDWIVPEWSAPACVHSFVTTRAGGVSEGPFGAPSAGGMNIGLATGDDPERVRANRALLRARLPGEPRWMHQVHGATVVDAATLTAGGARVQADAAFTTVPGVVCAVSVADCLPVAIAHAGGRGVAVAHAGWRGLAAGVIQNCVSALRTQLGAPDTVLLAWLGPAIGPARFEVGEEVLEAMRARLPHASDAFIAGSAGKFFADLPALARQSLAQVDVAQVSGGSFCTASDPARFYSFRRERVTGRHAAVIWLRD